MTRVSRTSGKYGNRDGLIRFIQLVLAGIGLAFIGLYIAIALQRLNYPYELEWLEGATVDHVARVLDGQAIYARPSMDFVAFIYTPFYYYVSAAMATVTGIGFLPLRIVSLAASLGCLTILFIWARRESGNWTVGLVAAGLFAATFRVTGAWFDLARVDSLALLFLIMGAYQLRFAKSRGESLVTALWLCLAIFTKQSYAPAVAGLCLYGIIADRKNAVWFVLPLVVLSGVVVVVTNYLTGGWFLYYVLTVPSRHSLDWSTLGPFMTVDLLKQAPVLILGVFACVRLCIGDSRKSERWWWLCLVGGFLVSGWLGRAHQGGYDNVLMPAYAALSLCGAVGIWKLADRFARGATARWRMLSSLIYAALGLQFVFFSYKPGDQIPSAWDRESAQMVVRSMARVKGEVLMPFHGYLPTLAGKSSQLHKIAWSDVTAADTSMKKELEAELFAALRTHRFSLLVLDASWYTDTVGKYYQLHRSASTFKESLHPLTGLETFPSYWLVPKDPDQSDAR
ncbi:MAG: glycosyltransferase family 39 protein [candidate division Zixibacteria bacterium]|nr:glycosyltransferase family 39 protein [candidate division Zixibacteria bacterium]